MYGPSIALAQTCSACCYVITRVKPTNAKRGIISVDYITCEWTKRQVRRALATAIRRSLDAAAAAAAAAALESRVVLHRRVPRAVCSPLPERREAINRWYPWNGRRYRANCGAVVVNVDCSLLNL